MEDFSPKTAAQFSKVVKRVYAECKIDGQLELARILEVSPPSVHRGFKDKALPARWLLTLMRKYNLNPDWLMYGEPHKKYMVATDAVPTSTELPAATEPAAVTEKTDGTR